ncbi:MAG: acetate kinase [Planctomycetaceae bacterium]|jgi:acetate kinase|nr:acetate kinase [Planctomycetaceae bacterium]|tara:strand:+ start:1599 stop:2798 length:1200 start_codon:yes stop_codon:yes gene_type:complete
MKILVANLGSTSFKFKLYDLDGEKQLARGAIDRIGGDSSVVSIQIGEGDGTGVVESTATIADHAVAVGICLDALVDPDTGCLSGVEDVAAIGFKAVFAAELSGVRLVDDALLERMESLSDVAPAHNPPYVAAMRQLTAAFPGIPLVAALETGFHETISAAQRAYAVPAEWQQHGVMRWGYHGASHRYIATRMAELTGREDLRVISCHLGGSSSLAAIDSGVSRAASMGMSPQSGLPHNNRVGDFDPFALPVLMRATGKGLEELLDDLASRSGLLGLSGLSGDLRDLEEAAGQGHAGAVLAVEHFVTAIRGYLASQMAVLGGADVVVFTGGIGENSVRIREAVCSDMDWCGLAIDQQANANARGEVEITGEGSRVATWVVPTNEELIVARQAAGLVEDGA